MTNAIPAPPAAGPPRRTPDAADPAARQARPVTRPATRWVWCLIGVLISVGTVIASVRLFVLLPATRMIDQAAFLGSTFGREEVEPYSRLVLGVVGPEFLVAATLVAVAIAVWRREFGDAVRAVVVVVGANLTTQLLKAALERPIDDLPQATYGNSLPSGHTTVAASVAAVLLIVAARSWRPPIALLGAAYAGATGIATMTLGWHRPSDVVAAFAVTSAWALLVLIPNRGRALADITVDPLRIIVAWLLGVVAVAGLVAGYVTMTTALATADGDLSSASALLAPSALRAAYVGACAGTAGAGAFFTWLQLLARR